MSSTYLEPAFIDGPNGRLFVLLRGPMRSGGGAVLVAPPFGDEMNKSRKMITDLARDLAARGLATVVVDPFGTGDSAGEFRDARWEGWIDDLLAAAAWSASRGLRVCALLGIRLGVLLAARVSARLPQPVRCSAFWQPVPDGGRFMTQFLRTRVAASLMEDRKETVGELRSRLLAGERLEVSGYEISPELAQRIEAEQLADAATPALGAIGWFEVAAGASAGLTATSQASLEQVRARVASIEAAVHAGEPFWTSTEIVRNPGLVQATAEFLARAA